MEPGTLPRALHSPCRHLQPPSHFLQWRQRHVSLAGLCRRQQDESHDRFLGRVHAPLSASRLAQRFCPYPALRRPGQLLPIGIHRFVPETPRDGAAGPVIGKRATKSVVAMPAVSDSSDRHPETDRCSTVLEVLIEQLRRLVVASFPFQPCDVLSHADADMCLFTRTRRYSMPAATACLQNRHLEAPYIAFRGGLRFAPRRSSRDNFNPHSRTFSIT